MQTETDKDVTLFTRIYVDSRKFFCWSL